MDELIKREDAIKVTWQEPSYTDAINALTEVRERIKDIPSAEKQDEWIPCSERLPEDPDPSFTYGSKTYQVTTASGNVVALKWQKTEVRGKTVMRWEWSGGGIYHGDVLAWKPLSEPWKGADNEA